jgi:hypothetical protein
VPRFRTNAVPVTRHLGEPAKLLAVFVVDTDEKELLTPYEK